MASSSYSARNCPPWKYDVFLSFRGKDTRTTFTSHLYKYLTDRGIITFLDDSRLEDGDSIPEKLMNAIEESQIVVIVFSKNYATSKWCLNELVKIMECDQEEKTVIPVFYGVEPSHVEHQSESFEKAFVEYDSNYKDDVEGMRKVKRWRTALSAAANLKGRVFPNGIESDCIERIVDRISSKCMTSVSYLHKVVGIDTQLEKVESLLDIEIDDVRIVWIWGMGGVGKTTIANAIFYKLSPSKYKDACFLENIKGRKHKMHSLQNILLSKLLGEKKNCVNNKEEGMHMLARRLQSKKVLVVLDDIDHKDQLNYLAGNLHWFGKGSRIIATTRDKHLIGKDMVHPVETLLDCDAIELFNQYAFGEEVPDECFKGLTLEIVRHAKGHPLALKVWGSLLNGKDTTDWESVLNRIKENSDLEIIENLRISYDGLQPQQQNIFLDIACFFRGKGKKEVMQVLESCYSGTADGLNALVNKSLVFIFEDDTIEMHDLIQDMGRYLVKMQNHPGERSRIWEVEDVKEVMFDNTGTMAVEAIWCAYTKQKVNLTEEAIWFTYSKQQLLSFDLEAMNNMKSLRILCIYDGDENLRMRYCRLQANFLDRAYYSNCDDDSIEYLPNSLRWFVWHDYPWKSLPENFEPTKLVNLDLRWSSLHHLWNETKHLPSLRKLDLSFSKSLMQTPDFTEMPSLKYLDLEKCTSLEEVHHSLKCCGKLIRLNLLNCKCLKRVPCVNVESLEYLSLGGCSSLEKFPGILGIMKPELKIDMALSGIRKLPSSIFIQFGFRLTKLSLKSMKTLQALPSSIGMLKGLVKLNVSCCSKLESLPEEIGDLENLEKLHASCTLISQPPTSIVHLNKLKSLSFANLKNRKYFELPQVNQGLHSLEILDLSYCNLIDGGLPEDIGCLSSLKELKLMGNKFEHLPRSIGQLGALQSLDLKYCTRLTQLPEFPKQLDTIIADWSNDSICNSLFQNNSSLNHDISASDSLSLRVFTSWEWDIPSWFHHRGMDRSVSFNLPGNWYISDNFLGFAVCYYGELIDTIAHLIPLCDGMPWMTKKIALSNHSEYIPEFSIHFFLVPVAGLWDTCKTNGKTPNDYGLIRLDFSGEIKKFGFHLLYKDKPDLEALLQIRENNDEPTEHSVTNEASCSSSKKQRSHSNVRGRVASLFRNFAALSCKPRNLA